MNKLKAITLIETIVYVAIFSMFMLTMMQFLISIQVNQDKVYKELELEMNRIFLTNHLEKTLRYNFNLEENTSVFDENNSIGVFANNQEELIYRKEEGELVLQKNLNTTKLTNSKALIQSFNLTPIRTEGNEITAIRINIDLAHRDNNRVTNNFSTLIRLANHEEE